MKKRDRILRIPYDDVSVQEALERIEAFLKKDGTSVVTYLSPEVVIKARSSKFLRYFIEEADLIIPSGRWVNWALSILKRPLREPIDYSQFVKLVLKQASELGKTVYFFGGNGRTIDRAYSNLIKENKELFVVGRYRADIDRKLMSDVIKAIGKASPDYFFIGIGMPQEQFWLAENFGSINAKIVFPVEGFFELVAGNRIRFRRESYKSGVRFTRINRVAEIPLVKPLRRAWYLPLFVIMVIGERIFLRR